MKTTMNKKLIGLIGLIGLMGLIGPVSAQEADSTAVNDTVIDRTVTVEREFQPTVKAAGKLSTKPQVYTPKFQEATVTYSEYSSPLNTAKNVNTLGYASTAFNRPHVQHGYIRGGVGHINTMLDFNYRVDGETVGTRGARGKKSKEGFLDLHAQHFGQWGRKMLEQSSLGLDYTKPFSAAQMYISAAGGSEFFTHYYRYIDSETNRFTTDWKNFNPADNQAFWSGDAKIGVQNIPGADILYQAETAYEGFFIPNRIQEHQVHTKAMFEWSKNEHHAGINADVRNRFYSGAAAITGKHSIHVEPYYAYEGNRIRAHAGVNLDLGLGGYKGRLNKSDVNAFGVSPNVNFEVDITKTWLTFFLNATGELAAEGIREELSEHRFLDVQNLLDVMQNGCCAAYVPVDAVAGFRFKPLPTLLFEVHGGYMFVQDEHILGYDSINTIFRHFEQDQQIVKVGGSLHYHYQDIFTMEISGDYFFGYGRELKGYTAKGFPLESLLDLSQGDWTTTSYSKPLWQVHARFDGRIDKHWSLYSDNYLVGRRTELRACPGTVAYGLNFNVPALIKSSDVTLKPYFDLNLGVEYTYNDRLAFFGQLNNFLAWNAELTPLLLYRTPSQGVNCLFGVSWNF